MSPRSRSMGTSPTVFLKNSSSKLCLLRLPTEGNSNSSLPNLALCRAAQYSFSITWVWSCNSSTWAASRSPRLSETVWQPDIACMWWVSHFQPNRNVYQVRCFKWYRVWNVFGKRTVRILAATPAVLKFSVVFLSLLSIYLNSILNYAATASFHALSSLSFTLNYWALWTYNQYINQQLLLIKYNSWEVSKLLHVSAPGCHPQGLFYNKGVQFQHAKLGIAWRVRLAFLCSRKFPEGGTLVPKRVGY